jgi:hypothetical protein
MRADVAPKSPFMPVSGLLSVVFGVYCHGLTDDARKDATTRHALENSRQRPKRQNRAAT